MTLKEACQIALELAEANTLSDKETRGSPELREEAKRQENAIMLLRQHLKRTNII